MFYLASENWL